jgi:lambda family phage portal protein
MIERIIDNIYKTVAPRRALQRMQARKIMREYDGARPNRMNAYADPKNHSAQVEQQGPFGADALRAWARKLVRDNAYAFGIIDTIVSSVIGEGIKVESMCDGYRGMDEDEVNDLRNKVWQEWCENCELTGQFNFDQLQMICQREMCEAGEVLVHLVTLPSKRHNGIYRPVPFALELIEADRLASDRDTYQIMRDREGLQIVRGVEMDHNGTPLAYWIYPAHPDSGYAYETTPIRIPASKIIHLFKRDRIGQSRGVTWFAPAIESLRTMGVYLENELQASAVASCFTMAIKTDGDQTGGLLPPSYESGNNTDEAGNSYDYLQAGMIMRLRPNESVESVNPTRPNTGAGAWINTILRQVAVGVGLSYETVARDYSQTNYSSNRASQLEDRRRFRRWQSYLCGDLLQPVWDEFFNHCAMIDKRGFPTMAELLDNRRKYTNVEFQPPRWEWVDPSTEQSSSEASIKAFQSTYQDELSGRGANWKRVFEQRAREEKLLKKLGLTSPAGQEQADAQSKTKTADAAMLGAEASAQPKEEKIEVEKPQPDLPIKKKDLERGTGSCGQDNDGTFGTGNTCAVGSGRGGKDGTGGKAKSSSSSKPSKFRNPFADNDGDGITDNALIGVDADETPPPPKIPRLPNLDSEEQESQDDFNAMIEANPEKEADRYREMVAAKKDPKKPLLHKSFNTDDAKYLNPKYDKDDPAAMAKHNLPSHAAANAAAKLGFERELDAKLKSGEMKKGDRILVTMGGVAAGKGYAVEQKFNDQADSIGAVWDTAGEQNGTELDWAIKQATKRGLNVEFVYVHTDPTDHAFAGMEGFFSRAKKKGRTPTSQVFGQSYKIGAENFNAGQKKYADQENVKWTVLDNPNPKSNKKARTLKSVPVAEVPDPKLLQERFEKEVEARDLPQYIKDAAMSGHRIFGDQKFEDQLNRELDRCRDMIIRHALGNLENALMRTPNPCGTGKGGLFTQGNYCATGNPSQGTGKHTGKSLATNAIPVNLKDKPLGEGVDRAGVKYMEEEWEVPKQKDKKPSVFEVVSYLDRENAERGSLEYEIPPEGDVNSKKAAEVEKRNDKKADLISDATTAEIMWALENAPEGESGAGWYERQMTGAMEIMFELYPEMENGKNLKNTMAFKSILAITSNGQEVRDNFKLADKLYQKFLETGEFPTSFSEGGKQKGAMKDSLKVMNHLYANYEPEDVFQFLKEDIKFGDLMTLSEEMGLPIKALSGENVDTMVTGSVIFGPKLGSFYNNLNGSFESTTMDLWFARTMGRIQGIATKVDPDGVRQTAKDLKREILFAAEEGVGTLLPETFDPTTKVGQKKLKAMKEAGGGAKTTGDAANDQHKRLFNSKTMYSQAEVIGWLDEAIARPEAAADNEELLEWINHRRKEYGASRSLTYNSDGSQKFETDRGPDDPRPSKIKGKQLSIKPIYKTFSDKTNLNKRSKTLYEKLVPIKAAPAGGGERNFYRDVMKKTQEKLAERGIVMNAADMQAVLWYNEKRLYTKFGYAGKGSETVDYLDAALLLKEKRKKKKK